MSRPTTVGGVLLATLFVALPGCLVAQGFRITGTSVADLVQIRPLVADSIPVALAGDTAAGSAGDLRLGPDGQIVRCTQGAPYCFYRRSGSTIAAVPMVQDIEVSGWGLTRGLRAYVHVRGRANGGDAGIFWPRADDPLDVLAAYVELDRSVLRARAGRQWHSSALGYYDFDGAALMWRPWSRLSLEAFGGLSLVRGLYERQTSEAIAALEPFAPDTGAYLLGAEARWRPSSRLSVSGIYQREVRTDRAGLYSERASAVARGRLFGATLDGQLVYDVAQTAFNEARLRLQLPPARRVSLALEARHHEPFFELWTIWGAFSPVGFDEGRALASWGSAGGALTLSVGGGPRRYDDPNAGFPGLELRRDGWRFTTDAAWQVRPAWTLQGGYAAEIGFGAARSDQSLALRRSLPRDGYAGLSFTAFQTAREFRIEDGRVLGGGADAGIGLLPGARADANLYLLHHEERGNGSPNWSQLRASIRLTWTLGREPGPRILGPGGAPAIRPGAGGSGTADSGGAGGTRTSPGGPAGVPGPTPSGYDEVRP